MSTAQKEVATDYVNRFRPSQTEIDRRYSNVRAAMEEHGLDALVVSGSEYSGFEGAIRYLAGFLILHRYAYVVITPDSDPVAVFPREATWVGDHSATFLENRELPPHCGEWIADYLANKGAKKVGIYGYEYIINVRDYSALAAKGFELIDFDIPFDYARAQKSDEEIASVRHSMDINKRGVLEVMKAYAPGKTEAELMGVAENALRAISVFVVVTGLVGMVTTILSGLNERRREMAILRSVGARPVHVLALLMSEAGVFACLGAFLGTLFLYAGMLIARPLLETKFGLFLSISGLSAYELAIIAVVVGGGFFIGLIPAYRAYRYTLADGMSIRV